MGRVVVVNFISIDGVIQSPLSPDEDRDGGFNHGGWVPPYGDDTVNAFMQKSTVGAAGMLLGRRTYEILVGAPQPDRRPAQVGVGPEHDTSSRWLPPARKNQTTAAAP